MQNFQDVESIVASVRQRVSGTTQMPLAGVGIVLGTGLGALAQRITDAVVIPYSGLVHMPCSTVDSHAGQFIVGRLNGVSVILQQGRCHLYEGYTPAQVCTGVRVMRGLGVRSLVITNAAGALNPQWEAGELMCITDHINLTGQTPLSGQNHAVWGERFPDMSCAYDPQYVAIAMQAAAREGIRLERGVYVGLTGPQMETPAETRYLRTIGADAVGMSTVLEVIAARHMGMRVLGISCLTNKNLPDCMTPAPLEDVLRVAGAASGKMANLVYEVVTSL